MSFFDPVFDVFADLGDSIGDFAESDEGKLAAILAAAYLTGGTSLGATGAGAGTAGAGAAVAASVSAAARAAFLLGFFAMLVLKVKLCYYLRTLQQVEKFIERIGRGR